MSKDEKPDEGAPKADPKDVKEPKAKEPEAPESEDKDPGDEATPGGGNDPATPKKPHWSQRRIDELTRNWRQEQREKAQLLELLRQREQQAKPAAQPQAQATKPQPNQYQTTEEFLEALADWKAEAKIQDWDRKRRTEAEEQARRESEQKRKQTFAEREAKARAKYEDYDLVALGDETPITELMAKVIFASELGPEIAYFIGKNPDKGQQIAQMSDPAQIALAIGRIEAQIEAQANPPAPAAVPSTPKAAPTAAPPPPKTLSGSAPPVQKLADDLPIKEWMALRNSQVRKKRA